MKCVINIELKYVHVNNDMNIVIMTDHRILNGSVVIKYRFTRHRFLEITDHGTQNNRNTRLCKTKLIRKGHSLGYKINC